MSTASRTQTRLKVTSEAESDDVKSHWLAEPRAELMVKSIVSEVHFAVRLALPLTPGKHQEVVER